MDVHSQFVTLSTADGDMEAFIAHPVGAARCPVVLVFQEAFGVNEHIQDICNRIANQGFFAIAPELYHRKGRRLEFDYSDRKAIMPLLGELTTEELTQDIKATLQWLEQSHEADEKNVGSLGFCLGGYVSILSAIELNLKVAVSYYGAGVIRPREGLGYRNLHEKLSEVNCPLLFFFGEEDPSIPLDEVTFLKDRLEDLTKEHRIIVFQDANHGFFCDKRKSYHPEAAEKSWEITINWLGRYLQGSNSGEA